MNRSLGAYIVKSETKVIIMNDLGGNLSVYDSFEKVVGKHGHGFPE
ncbi:MAG: hypothetical protein NT142_04260 [Planctomycetota bacterium]|nr:hypothetical protein [Planctomycetota bacterium]